MRIPIDQIDPLAIPRDRSILDTAAMTELRASIARSGLRQPVEVFATQTGYGLISGYRRLQATRELHQATGQAKYAEIDAILRSPQDQKAALASMVEENDIRADLSPWERAAIATAAHQTGIFETLDAALIGLYPHAHRQKRAKLRAIAEVVEALGDSLTDPEDYSETRLLRLSAVLRMGWFELLSAALTQGAGDAQSQWVRLQPLLSEAETLHAQGKLTNPNRPKRLVRPKPGLTVRREKNDYGYTLHITGPAARTGIVQDAIEQLELWLKDR